MKFPIYRRVFVMNCIVEHRLICVNAKFALQISILKVKVDLNLRDDCKPGPRCACTCVHTLLKFYYFRQDLKACMFNSLQYAIVTNADYTCITVEILTPITNFPPSEKK